MPRPPISTLFPYTTLFRSIGPIAESRVHAVVVLGRDHLKWIPLEHRLITVPRLDGRQKIGRATSELQSQSNLVCRLLLEKKKKNHEDDGADDVRDLRQGHH